MIIIKKKKIIYIIYIIIYRDIISLKNVKRDINSNKRYYDNNIDYYY